MGSNDIGIGKSEFVAKTQFLSELTHTFLILGNAEFRFDNQHSFYVHEIKGLKIAFKY